MKLAGCLGLRTTGKRGRRPRKSRLTRLPCSRKPRGLRKEVGEWVGRIGPPLLPEDLGVDHRFVDAVAGPGRGEVPGMPVPEDAVETRLPAAADDLRRESVSEDALETERAGRKAVVAPELTNRVDERRLEKRVDDRDGVIGGKEPQVRFGDREVTEPCPPPCVV